MLKFGGLCLLGEERGGQHREITFLGSKDSILAAILGSWGVRFAAVFGAKVMCLWDAGRFLNFFSLIFFFLFSPEPGKSKFTLILLSDPKDVTSGLLVLLMGSTGKLLVYVFVVVWPWQCTVRDICLCLL